MSANGDVASVAQLDLQRYLGLWFEIGRLPLRFEDDDAIRVTAEYSLREDGSIRVDNRCIDGEGAPTQALGQADPVEGIPAGSGSPSCRLGCAGSRSRGPTTG
ncbi:lipocalin family protein [Leucobacter sp. HNU]|uniref:lipocalin family protein n=1 Tax=Leucobacter sp. HNU TaxID=3236805 RepID=UPI003A7F67A3